MEEPEEAENDEHQVEEAGCESGGDAGEVVAQGETMHGEMDTAGDDRFLNFGAEQAGGTEIAKKKKKKQVGGSRRDGQCC